MAFQLDCECGRAMEVSGADCGTALTCRCGRNVRVPTLSELKLRAGQPAYEPDIAEKVRWMTSKGELPSETHCVVCRNHTPSSFDCYLECQTVYTPNSGYWNRVFLALILPVWIWSLLRCGTEQEPLGSELVVKMPVRLCEACQDRLGHKPRRIRQLLYLNPLYRQLLEKYPKAPLILP